jgi:SAM-dependent methyltransferase
MADTPNPFDLLARFYDWEHESYDDDIAMYLGFAKRTEDPILEVACGSGRLLLPLAMEGLRVVGIDSSAEMLAVARDKLGRAGYGERVELHHADVRAFEIGATFRLAIFALDSFGLLHRRADHHAALGRIRAHLVRGGLLVLDVSNGNLRGGEAPDELILQHHGPAPSTGHPLTKWMARSTDLAAQLDRFTYMYDEVQPDGVVKRLTAELALRYFGRYELELLLERAGFAIEALYGSYDLAPFASDSERLIAVAVNPGSASPGCLLS